MVGNSRSRSITEDKQHSDAVVLRWGTTREGALAQGSFFASGSSILLDLLIAGAKKRKKIFFRTFSRFFLPPYVQTHVPLHLGPWDPHGQEWKEAFRVGPHRFCERKNVEESLFRVSSSFCVSSDI